MTLSDTSKSTSEPEEHNLREMAGDKKSGVAENQSSAAQVSRSGKGPPDPATVPNRRSDEPSAQVSRSQKSPDDEPSPSEPSSGPE